MAKIPGMNIEYSFGEDEAPVNWRELPVTDSEDYDEEMTEEEKRRLAEHLGFDIYADEEGAAAKPEDDEQKQGEES